MLAPGQLWADSPKVPFVVVAHAPGTDQFQGRVEVELELLGYRVEPEHDSEAAMRRAVERADAAAAVWIRSSHRIDLWFLRGSSATEGPDRIVIEALPEETTELLALRAVELLRGRLVPVSREHPGGAGANQEPETGPPQESAAAKRLPLPEAEPTATDGESGWTRRGKRWSLGLGLGLLQTTSFSAIPLGIAELGWKPSPRWTVALLGAASLRTGNTTLEGTRAEATAWIVAAEPRFEVLGGESWALEAAPSFGWRGMRLDRQPEDPFEPFTETKSGGFGGAGALAHYSLIDRIELRGTAGFLFGPSLSWVIPTGPEQAQGNGEGQSTDVSIAAQALAHAVIAGIF